MDAQQPHAATADTVAALSAEEPCPICTHEQEIESDLLASFLENLAGDAGLLDAHRASDGLCLPYFKATLASCRDVSAARRIAQATSPQLCDLLAHLQAAMEKRKWADAPPLLAAEEAAWTAWSPSLRVRLARTAPPKPRARRVKRRNRSTAMMRVCRGASPPPFPCTLASIVYNADRFWLCPR